MELRRRYPAARDGELTTMRSALVSNVHLGRLLTRRYGTASAREFFADVESERQRDAITRFVTSVPCDGRALAAPAGLAEALERHTREQRNAEDEEERAKKEAEQKEEEERKKKAEERVEGSAKANEEGTEEGGGGEGGSSARAEGAVAASYSFIGKRGDDYRKPTGETHLSTPPLLLSLPPHLLASPRHLSGDVYEALVGAVLHELGELEDSTGA